MRVDDVVRVLIGFFRNGVGTTVASVGDFGVAAADQGTASEEWAAVGVYDAEIGGYGFAFHGVDVGVLGTVVAEAKLVDDVRREDAGVSASYAAGMIDVVAGGKSGGEVGEEAGDGVVVLPIAVACEEGIFRGQVVVETNVKVVVVGDAVANSEVVIDDAGSAGQVVGVEVVETSGVCASGGYDVGNAAGGELRAGGGVKDSAVVRAGVEGGLRVWYQRCGNGGVGVTRSRCDCTATGERGIRECCGCET